MHRRLVLMLCLLCSACGGGGGGGSGLQFHKGSCSPGVSLSQVNPQGYDILFNTDGPTNPPTSITLDADSVGTICEYVDRADVFPWVRVDLDGPSFNDPNRLVFQLVRPGGRNSEVLLSEVVSDPSASGVQGGFAFKLHYDFYNGDSLSSTLDCEVTYDGNYCALDGSSTGNGGASYSYFSLSANGRLHCRSHQGNGAPDTECGGRIAASNAIFTPGYYGE